MIDGVEQQSACIVRVFPRVKDTAERDKRSRLKSTEDTFPESGVFVDSLANVGVAARDLIVRKLREHEDHAHERAFPPSTSSW
jgi:hypothetical protein